MCASGIFFSSSAGNNTLVYFPARARYSRRVKISFAFAANRRHRRRRYVGFAPPQKKGRTKPTPNENIVETSSDEAEHHIAFPLPRRKKG